MGDRIAIVGVGANGGSIAGDLTRAGLDVTCIEQWPEHVEAIQARGLRIESPDGETVTPLKIHQLCEVATLRRPFDVVFVVVKAYDTRWACELVKPLVSPSGVVVGIQNGMSLDAMAGIFGVERTLGTVIEICANMFEPGVVDRQTARAGTWFNLGGIDGTSVARESDVAEILSHCGVVERTDDIRSAKWMKLVANAAEMLPSAILGLPLVEALQVPGIREVMDAAGTEALDVALSSGNRIVPMFGKEGIEQLPPESYSAALLDTIVTGWSLEDTRVAVLQDWMKGRRAETEDINGLVVEARARLGGSAPVNERLVEVGRSIESGDLEPGVENADLMRSAMNA